MDSSRLIGIASLATLSILLWFVFLRRRPEEQTGAFIESKALRSAGTYIQQPVETNRGFRMPREIPVAESFVFELRLDGVAEPVRASFNTVKSRQFETGQRVRVQYVRRGLGPLWSRYTVIDMSPTEGR